MFLLVIHAFMTQQHVEGSTTPSRLSNGQVFTYQQKVNPEAVGQTLQESHGAIDRSTFHVSDSGGIRLGARGTRGTRQNWRGGKTWRPVSLNLCFQLSIGSIITAWNQISKFAVNLDQFNQFHCLTLHSLIHESKSIPIGSL